MMDTVQKKVQVANLRLFFISTVLILFFITAVKFNIRQASLMLGQQWPAIKTEQWVTLPLDMEKTNGKVVLIFFYKDDVEIARKLLEWSYSLREIFGKKGFLAIALVSQPDEGKLEATKAKLAGPYFYAAVDNGRKNRKSYLGKPAKAQ